MHTVRNRLASRPPVGVPAAPVSKLPDHAALRHELALIQRGAKAVPLASPDECGLIEGHPPKRRNAKGKKARKAAARLAQAREAQARETQARETQTAGLAAGDATAKPQRARKAAGKRGAKARRARERDPEQGRPEQGRTVLPEQLPAIPAAPLLEQRLAVHPVLALPLPPVPEPLVEPAPARVLSLSALPGLIEPQAHASPAAPEAGVAAPVVEQVAPPSAPAESASESASGSRSEPEPEPQAEPDPEPDFALADVPLPRARALVPARRLGLVDVIAFLLRDSGRRLARWSARRHKSRAERDALRRAEARQINLQRELEALDALRRAKG